MLLKPPPQKKTLGHTLFGCVAKYPLGPGLGAALPLSLSPSLGLGLGFDTWKCLGTASSSMMEHVKYNLPLKRRARPHTPLAGWAQPISTHSSMLAFIHVPIFLILHQKVVLHA